LILLYHGIRDLRRIVVLDVDKSEYN